MSAREPEPIALVVEDSGQVMVSASGVIAYLRDAAEAYGSGKQGGSLSMRRGAKIALKQIAQELESACIDVAADELTQTWWRS